MTGFSAGVRRRVGRMLLLPQRVVARRLEGKTRGQAMIYVALMMMMLLGFGALVADGGLLFLNRRQMQNAVDAAALAGAQSLPFDTLSARNAACEYGKTRNGVPGMVLDCGVHGLAGGTESCAANVNVDVYLCQTYMVNDSIRVTARKRFDPLFGLGLGFATIEIRTQATAVVGSITAACIDPLFQTEGLLRGYGVWGAIGVSMNNLVKMKTTVQNSVIGGSVTLLLQLDGSSSKEEAWGAIGNPGRCVGPTAPLTSKWATTNPGNAEGQFRPNMQRREDAWNAQNNCVNPVAPTYLREDGRLWKYPLGTEGNIELAPDTCFRMMVIPLLDADVTTMNGSQTYAIRGFLNFYVSYWCGKNAGCLTPVGPIADGEIWGYFVGLSAAGGQDIAKYDGFTHVVTLSG